MTALVIRTLYNNESWREPCKSPDQDKVCYFCIGNPLGLNIKPPTPGCNPCDGKCWEQILCKEYFWGYVPIGNFWGKEAQPGIKVFFVFRQNNKPNKPNRLYTLWGKTTISSKDDFIDSSGQTGKNGYNLIHFAPFNPAERGKWKWNLTANFIVGNPWGQGNIRYIDHNIEKVLDSLI